MQEQSEIQSVNHLPPLLLIKNKEGLYPVPTMRCGILPYFIDANNKIFWGVVESNRVEPITFSYAAGIQDIIAIKEGCRFRLEVGKQFPDLGYDFLKDFVGKLFRDDPGKQTYQAIVNCFIDNGFNLFIENPLDTAYHETMEEHGFDLKEHNSYVKNITQMPVRKLSGERGAHALCLWLADLNCMNTQLNYTVKIENKIRRNFGRSFYEKGCWETLDAFKIALKIEEEKFSAILNHTPEQISLISGVFKASHEFIGLVEEIESIIKQNLLLDPLKNSVPDRSNTVLSGYCLSFFRESIIHIEQSESNLSEYTATKSSLSTSQ